jgi:hypothetical protein
MIVSQEYTRVRWKNNNGLVIQVLGMTEVRVIFYLSYFAFAIHVFVYLILSLLVADESRHCTVTLTAEPQHIVVGSRSPLTQSDNVGCGTASHPWSIEGLAGQRIAVSTINFSES